MAARILVLNGPNLNMLGQREPHIYGTTTLAEIERSAAAFAAGAGARLTFVQSDNESVLIAALHKARGAADAVVVNPAGLSFTSVALVDALKIFEGPVVEVHISNIHARDDMHRHSKVSAAADAVVCGLGPQGYILAIQGALRMIGARPRAARASRRRSRP